MKELDWRTIAARILAPERSRANVCRERIAEVMARTAERGAHRVAAITRVETHLNQLRAKIRAAEGAAHGRIPYEMTEIEREARRLMREGETDQRETMEKLWRELGPQSESDDPRALPPNRESLFALASDRNGIRAVVASVERLRVAMTPWGITLPPSVAFEVTTRCAPRSRAVIEAPMAAAMDALEKAGVAHAVKQHAHRERRAARLELAAINMRGDGIARRFSGDLYAALVWRAAVENYLVVPEPWSPAGRKFSTMSDPFAPLLEIWAAGYVPADLTQRESNSRLTLQCAPIDTWTDKK